MRASLSQLHSWVPLMARSAIASIVFLSVSLVAYPAISQMSPFVNGFENTLSGDDMNIIISTSERLFAQGNVADGATENWSDPKTGNGGTITLLQSFTDKGMPCRKVRYDNRIAGIADARSYTVNWCKTQAGAWKID